MTCDGRGPTAIGFHGLERGRLDRGVGPVAPLRRPYARPNVRPSLSTQSPIVHVRQHWPRWLLIAAVVVGMATTGGAGPGGPLGLAAAGPQRRPGVLSRVLLGSGAGLLVGGYTSLELLPEQVPLQVRGWNGKRCIDRPDR